jgi:hypothetical protein
LRSHFARFVLTVSLAVTAGCAAAQERDAASVDAIPSLLKDEWYSEGWDQIFYFADGSLLVSQITVLNIGFGSHHAGVFAMLVDPEGERTIVKQSRSNRDWEFSESELDLRIANHRLHGRAAEYHALVSQKSNEIELTIRSIAAPWRLGRTLDVEGDYQYVSFYAPLADAEGRYRLGSGGDDATSQGWRLLSDGRGFAVRYVNSTGLHDLIRSATRVVDLERSAISPVLYTSVDLDGGAQNHIALFEDGEILHEAAGFDMRAGGRVETAGDDTRTIPDDYRIDVQGEGFELTGSYTIQSFLARVDPVDSLKPFVRAIVRLLNTPIQYRYLATYDLEYTAGDVKHRLEGRALLDHMVLRHERKQSTRTRNMR